MARKPMRPHERTTGQRVCFRSVETAARDLGLYEPKLPQHIANFGEFMLRKAQERTKPRDVVKAYLLTRSSVRRAAVSKALVDARWPGNPLRAGADGKVRPEDIFAEILLTSDGRRFLDAAEHGTLDRKASRAMMARMPGGLHKTLLADFENAVDLARAARDVESALKDGTRQDWFDLTALRVPGIGPAKAGFWAAFMGRGDLPTFDAREINFWVRRVTNEKGKPRDLEVTFEHVEKLRRRLRALGIRMPKHLRPFYDHLAHHFVWDRLGDRGKPTITTHCEPVKAMRLAGLGAKHATMMKASRAHCTPRRTCFTKSVDRALALGGV